MYSILAPFMKRFFFLYFSLFASYVKPSAVYICHFECSFPFFILVPSCLSLYGNNHVIWKVCLKVAYFHLWGVLFLAATVGHRGTIVS